MQSPTDPVLNDFVDCAVSGGYVLAIALVCLLQYAVSVLRFLQTRHQNARINYQIEGLEDELALAQKDRAIARLENQILTEFVAEPDVGRALDRLLRRLVPSPREGFAAFIQFHDGEIHVCRSRGLQDGSRSGIRIDGQIQRRLAKERTAIFTSSALLKSRIIAGMMPADRQKAKQVCLIAAGPADNLYGALLTTAMYPAGAAQEQQLTLAKKLMVNVAGNLRRTEELEQQQHQLRSTSEMLQLRAIIDERFDTPLDMVLKFLERLVELVAADRAALFVPNRLTNGGNKALIRCGRSLQKNLEIRWHQHEDTLANSGLPIADIRTSGRTELVRLGIGTLIHRALSAPIHLSDGTLGTICLTKRDEAAFTKAQVELIGWSAQLLADKMERALNFAAVERQARLDGLTQLANRRTFDREIRREIHESSLSGGECSLLLLDLDHFKAINDTYGHLAGDAILKATANLLCVHVGTVGKYSNPVIARYGGEELAVFLPKVDASKAAYLAEEIRKAIEKQTVDVGRKQVSATVSIGVAAYPGQAASAEELISVADAALYSAKDSGRNQVVCLAAALA